MSDAILTFILENLGQLLIQEVELLAGVNDELLSLSDQLKLMRAFLVDFEWVRHEHKSVEELVNLIRDLAYDAEDIVEDYVASAFEYKSKWNKFLPGSSKLTTKRSIAKRIQDLKNRTEELDKNRTKLGIEAKPPDTVADAASRSRGRRPPIVEEIDVVGFKHETEILVKQLIEGDKKRSVVAIVGMGGLGKTTLTKKIYNDFRVKDSFKYRAWAFISQDNTREGTVLSILKCLTKITEEMKEMNDEELGNELLRQLTGKRYLIVMDDVWEPHVWKNLKPLFPDDNNGSRILFTTRVRDVAQLAIADRNSPPHDLRLLYEEESWELFRKKSLIPADCSPRLEEVGRQIALKCGGLPLALVVIGSLMSVTPTENIQAWSKAATRVMNILSERSAECKDILALSYKELPHKLKPCFVYLGVFPEDYQISARQLIQLWVAEGFIQALPDETMEDTAEKYLDMLVNRSLIQVSQRRSDGGVKTCSIHDLLRDLCISEAARERFLDVHGLLNSRSPTNPRRLAGNAKTIQYISENANTVKQLRSFLCFTRRSDTLGAWGRLFRTMRYLRVFKVLDLGVVPKQVENLPFLRYLGMDTNSFLENPSSIGSLFNLQILEAKSKSIRSAPAGIWKLRKLRHVYFEGPTIIPRPPPASSSSSHGNDESTLNDLQTLSTISAASCTPHILSKMPNLLKLGVEGNLNTISENLAALEVLDTLKLARVADFPPLISLPCNLPPSLTKITLSDTLLEVDPMPLLGNLPKLRILKLLNNAYAGRKMICAANGFKQLQVLKFVNSEHIREVLLEKGTMPILDHLVIHDCLTLVWLTGVQFLTTLKVVDLRKPPVKLRQRMVKFNERFPFQLHIYPPRQHQDD